MRELDKLLGNHNNNREVDGKALARPVRLRMCRVSKSDQTAFAFNSAKHLLCGFISALVRLA